MKTIAYTSAARRQLKKLPSEVQAQISAALRSFADGGEGDVLKLKGRAGAYRLRSGDYRVVFAMNAETLTVEAVGDRKEIYR